MPFVNVTIKHIEVHHAGEAEAEWRLTVKGKAAAGGSGDYETTWEHEPVINGGTYDINKTWLFILNQGEKIEMASSGSELDGGLFDPDDVLPGFRVTVDPLTAGSAYRVEAKSGGTPEEPEFFYTLEMSFNPINI